MLLSNYKVKSELTPVAENPLDAEAFLQHREKTLTYSDTFTSDCLVREILIDLPSWTHLTCVEGQQEGSM